MLRSGRVLSLLCLLLAGCASSSSVSVQPGFTPRGWESIAVLPFSGTPAYRDLAAETFVVNLLGRTPYRLIQPGAIVEQVTRITASGEGEVTISQARQIAQEVGAQAVVLGNVTSYDGGTTLNATATVRLVDVSSGEIVAATQRPSGLLIASSEQQTVVRAVERAASDLAGVINRLPRP